MSDTGNTVFQKKIFTDTKARTKPLLWWRRLSQLIFFAIMGQWSFYGIFRCPFIVPYVSCQNCPVVTCHGRLLTMFWGFWLLLPVSVILFGRAFCGWACPGGFVNQIFGIISPIKLRIKNTLTKTAPWFKYVALLLALYGYYVMAQPRVNVPIRIGEFINSISLTFEHANTIWLVRTFIVIGFIVVGLVIGNLWCRFLCPTGGILDALKGISLFKVYKTSACNDCNKCLKICEMGTRPAETNCNNCCDCISVCPQDAIKTGRVIR
ncbi:MAG: 4Fe-4S binding protein [Desulfatiglans sp.]|jgi:polyferredoxin|nr:4Fe-4S binding protein [Desulfatiglans sp.]